MISDRRRGLVDVPRRKSCFVHTANTQKIEATFNPGCPRTGFEWSQFSDRLQDWLQADRDPKIV
jgi:hypothetical protein